MGCMVVPFLRKMMLSLPPLALFWLLLGGVFYIGGTYFYAKDKQIHRYVHTHEIWHVFVNMGALSHYIYNYVYVFK
ncbi:channel protein, hemolysin III family [compost metagenome]